MSLTVGDLKKALTGVPDDMEVCVGLHGNQDDVWMFGVAKRDKNGVYEINENEKYNYISDDLNFLIKG